LNQVEHQNVGNVVDRGRRIAQFLDQIQHPANVAYGQRHEDHVDKIGLHERRHVGQLAEQRRPDAGTQALGTAVIKEPFHLHGRQVVVLQACGQRKTAVVVACKYHAS
jgi:hypothetical protein